MFCEALELAPVLVSVGVWVEGELNANGTDVGDAGCCSELELEEEDSIKEGSCLRLSS